MATNVHERFFKTFSRRISLVGGSIRAQLPQKEFALNVRSLHGFTEDMC